MGIIHLVRHGETEFHADGKILGRLDVGLNGKGREQALRVREYFRGVDLAAVYSSPLKRCLETAEPTAEDHGLEIGVMDGLMEVDMGDWDGRSLKELLSEDAETVGRWMSNPSSVPIPGGEDFSAVQRRVREAVDEIIRNHGGKDQVMVVTHGGPIRGILCEALRLDLDKMLRIDIALASVSKIEFFHGSLSEAALVTLVNDVCHLRGLVE